MAPKFKKGDQVYRIGNWNGKGCWFYELVEITSWGKKHGTYLRNGNNSEDRIHVNYVNTTVYANHFYLANNINPEIKALELAQKFIQYEIECIVERCNQNPTDDFFQNKLEEIKSYQTSVIELAYDLGV